MRIERASRLIETEHFWLHAQRPRNGHALGLSTGELIGILRRFIAKAHPLQKLHGARLGLLPRHVAHFHGRQSEIAQHGKMGKQVERLVHHAHAHGKLLELALRSILCPAVFFAADPFPVELNFARIHGFQPVQAAQKCALTRAGRADDRHHLALFHAERHAPEHFGSAKALVDSLRS